MSQIFDDDVSRRRFIRNGTLLSSGLFGQINIPLIAQALNPNVSPIPRPSEVSFSSRFTNQPALPIAHQFGASRIDWTYSLDPAFLRSARLLGAQVIGGTINACMPDKVGGNTYKEARALRRDGTPVTAPWMAGEATPRYWGCANNPGYEDILLEAALAALNAGADYLQFDDAALSIPAVKWGACWCSYCRQKAVSQGYSLLNEMLAFQTKSTQEFISRFRVRLNRKAGRAVIMSSNNFEGDRRIPYNLFDFGMCEFSPKKLNADDIVSLYRSFESIGWYQSATLQTANPQINRAAIATIHASGGNCIVPWDVFLGVNQRYFGKQADYLPIYNMIRRSRDYLDYKRFSSVEPSDLLTNDTLDRLLAANIHVLIREDPKVFIIHMIPWTVSANLLPVSIAPKWAGNKLTKSTVNTNPAYVAAGGMSISRENWSILTLSKT